MILPRLLVLALVLAAAGSAQEPAPQPSFDDFVSLLRAEALSRGISEATVTRAFTDLTPVPVVVVRDRGQPEQTLSLDTYIARRLTSKTITSARLYAKQHAALLAKLEARFGIPGPLVIAVWGLESNFGRFTGTYPTVRALVTLAYDGRRPLFRRELFDALTILDRGDIEFERLKGSWAGAMGQPQFMPSSYLEHAVDFDGDGRRDIWSSVPDVLGSIANYLKAHGWTSGARWGREVVVPAAAMAAIDRTVSMRTSGCRAEVEMTAAEPLTRWRALGVKLAGGGSLPAADIEASLVKGERRHFLVYANYGALLGYNCSNAYALSAGLLADRVAVAPVR